MPTLKLAHKAADRARSLEAVLRLIQKSRQVVQQLDADDAEGKGELLDALAVAEISALRLLAEEAADGLDAEA